MNVAEVSKPVLYFVERRTYKARLKHLTLLASKADFFDVVDSYSGKVTHVVAQESNRTEVLEFLRTVNKVPYEVLKSYKDKQIFVDVSWFSACMKAKKVESISDEYLLKDKENHEEPCPKRIKLDEQKIPMYACQRPTPLNHKNKQFTDALEVLAEHALYRGDSNADARSLAFRRGSATLKSLPYQISQSSDLKNLPYIDIGGSSKPGHCKRVIIEILSTGYSREVEEVSNNEFFMVMKLFCGIFGIGPQTARKWYHDLKLRTLDDVRNCSSISLSRDQSYGLKYYEDLNSPLPLEDAEEIKKLVMEAALSIQAGVEITLVGGFRRGKTSGHDIDLLITHPEEGKEKSILHRILSQLQHRFLYSEKVAGSKENPFQAKSSSAIDNFEKCYGILKVFNRHNTEDKDQRGAWTARRVDLIVVPYSQFPFALLGWTGSKHFEREIRRYAKTEKQMVLTSHGMFTLEQKQSIPASSEKEIFDKLGLDYQEPSMRNC